MYVIVKSGTREFVADMTKSRTGKSYTRNVFEAKLFDSEEQARHDLCPVNERVARLETLLKGASG